ncbi:uncharacterized protein LOC128397760 [Panonychus citri]|uniref:uncharacterized protein LOC128397760 n=1 Tax=Panonychus citri TaxID=50023 RepID=UPI002307FA25|nr:uncharacterized protein LOC128397760 [Panonychus citri]
MFTIEDKHAVLFLDVYTRDITEVDLDWHSLLTSIKRVDRDDVDCEWNLEKLFLCYNAYCLGREETFDDNNIEIDNLFRSRRETDAVAFRFKMASIMITSEHASFFKDEYKRPRRSTSIHWKRLRSRIIFTEADFGYLWSYENVFLAYNAYCFAIEQVCREKNIPINQFWAERRVLDIDYFQFIFENPARWSSENDGNRNHSDD